MPATSLCPCSWNVNRSPARRQDILTRCGDAPVYTADREMLARLTGYELTRGVLCAFRRPAPRTVESVCRDARRVAVLEGIVDSTNVGAIFRSAAALNMDAVLITPSCCDPLPPGGAREHGHRVPGALGADRHHPRRLAGTRHGSSCTLWASRPLPWP